MSDDMIRCMADRGGVIQINFYPVFLSDSFARSFELVEAEHPEYEQAEADYRANPADQARRARRNGVTDILMKLERPGVSEVVDHIDHAVKVGGIEHVGIGTDFDGDGGIRGIGSAAEVINFTRRLLAARYSEQEIGLIWGDNFLRVMEKVQDV